MNDTAPPPCRALLVVPAANTTMAEEIAALCPWLASLAVARVPSPPQGIARDLAGYRANTLAAVEPFLADRPDLVIFGCTAAGFHGGPRGNAETVAALRRLTGGRAVVVSTADAMLEVLRHEGASRVAVVTPYAQEVNDRLTAYLEGSGLTVTALDSFLCATPRELLAITQEQLFDKALAADTRGAEALFIACSHLRGGAALVSARSAATRNTRWPRRSRAAASRWWRWSSAATPRRSGAWAMPAPWSAARARRRRRSLRCWPRRARRSRATRRRRWRGCGPCWGCEGHGGARRAGGRRTADRSGPAISA